MKILFAVPSPTGKHPSVAGYRYFIDLKNGAFIYVFPKDFPPPADWPLVELNGNEVEELLTKDEQ